jgi:hypothetical protein
MGSISGFDWMSAKYLIADDIEWEFFKCKKQLLGGQREFTATQKYTRMVTVRFGKPVIYLSNTDPRDDMSCSEREYYDMNVIYYVMGVNEKFY